MEKAHHDELDFGIGSFGENGGYMLVSVNVTMLVSPLPFGAALGVADAV